MTDTLIRETNIPVIAIVSIHVPDLATDEKPLRIGEYKIDTHVNGLYAHISTEFTIHNDNHRTFEGELEFPLPDGGVVCGYAIDVNGVMIPASVVEKEKARIAFETEVKLGVDPGLVEQVRGNAYRTRIYPILANGSRRIRLDYVAPLVLGDKGEAALYLPMPHTKLAKRDLVISVDIPNIPAPVLSGLGNRTFAQAQATWRVETHDTDVTPDDDILMAMPALPDTLTAIETFNGDTFFTASIRAPELPKQEGSTMPKNWRILWDASGSRAEADIKKALTFIDVLPKDAHYELHVFRNDLDDARTFDTSDALKNELEAVCYDGGTDFNVLKDLVAKAYDGMTLFFTDGFDTFTGALPEFGSACAALVSSKLRDMSVLRHICGGMVFDLSVLTPAQILDRITHPSLTVCALKGQGLENVEGLGVPSAGRLTLVGRLTRASVDADIVLTNGDSVHVQLDRNDAKDGKTIALAWAARRVDALSPDAEANREELLALGRHFSIVSPVSSMIVFERLDQWIKYDIEPPKELADIHEQWLKQRKVTNNEGEDATAAWIRTHSNSWFSSLKSEWRQRLDWWNNPIPHNRKPKSGVFDDEIMELPSAAIGGGAPSSTPRRRESAPRGVQAAMSAPVQFLGEHIINPLRRAFSGNAQSESNAGMQPMATPNAGMAERERDLVCDEECAPRRMEDEPRRSEDRRAPARAPRRMESERTEEVFEDECCACEECCDECEPSSDNDTQASSSAPDAAITIKAWNPDMPYLKEIKDAAKIFSGSNRLYEEYLKQRKLYHTSPSFYLDCASLFFSKKENKYAIRILSNLSELKLDDPALLRVYAWRLREVDELDLALVILHKVAKLRPDEAVSFRDLALTYTLRAKKHHSAEDAEKALEYFKHVMDTPCPRRDAVYTAVVAIEEFNALAAWCKEQKWEDRAPVIPEIDDMYKQNLDTDIRIVLMWDADDTDIDLHVLEPNGEEVYYSNKRSASGGMISQDVTTGYGPEEYLHKKAIPGKYKIVSNYFASHQQKLTGPVTVTATVFTNWGRPNEKSQTMSLQLLNAKDHVSIGEIKI